MPVDDLEAVVTISMQRKHLLRIQQALVDRVDLFRKFSSKSSGKKKLAIEDDITKTIGNLLATGYTRGQQP